MGNCCETRISTQDQLSAHSADAFVVSCMDFRLVDDTVRFLDSKGYNNNYDGFVLAGASLGFTQGKYPQWAITLLNHMHIGKELHSFRKIIFIDHRQCGAFKKFYPNSQPEDEENLHRIHMQKAYDTLSVNFPNLDFKGYLMDLHGQCIELQVKKRPMQIQSQAREDPFLALINKN